MGARWSSGCRFVLRQLGNIRPCPQASTSLPFWAGCQSRAQSLSGSLSAVGSRENSGIMEFLWILFEFFDWLFAEQQIKKNQKIIKGISLSQSFSRRPTADKQAWRLWVRDWRGAHWVVGSFSAVPVKLWDYCKVVKLWDSHYAPLSLFFLRSNVTTYRVTEVYPAPPTTQTRLWTTERLGSSGATENLSRLLCRPEDNQASVWTF